MNFENNKLLAFIDNSYFTTFGTILLSVGCAFIGGYDHNVAWTKVSGHGVAEFIAYVLTNPVIALIVSIPLLTFSEIVSNVNKRNLERNNKELTRQNDTIPSFQAHRDKSEEDLQTLRSDIYELHQHHVRTWLKSIFKHVGLDTHSRISVYYENSDSFSLLARYSSNPALAKSHKQRFQLNQGVISQAWQHGEHFDDQSPSYEDNPEDYNAHMIKVYKYSNEQLDGINMKSCTFLGLSITQADENIGVILFESTEHKAFSEDERDKMKDYCKDFESHLCNFVRDGIIYDKSISIKNNLPSLNNNDLRILAELGVRDE